jgi:hypothetical protein
VAPATLQLLSRPDCELCEHMLRALEQFARREPLPPLALVDVDSDALLRRRYGLKIPVLLLEGSPVCSGALDEQALREALRAVKRVPSADPS